MWSFGVSFDVSLGKMLNKQLRSRWIQIACTYLTSLSVLDQDECHGIDNNLTHIAGNVYRWYFVCCQSRQAIETVELSTIWGAFAPT